MPSTYTYDRIKDWPAWSTVVARCNKHQAVLTKGHATRRDNQNAKYLAEIAKLQTAIAKLEAKIADLRVDAKEKCPHLTKYHVVEVTGREDDYGGYLPGRDCVITCNRCDTKLEEWRDER